MQLKPRLTLTLLDLTCLLQQLTPVRVASHHFSMNQVAIDRISDLPNLPSNYEMVDWRGLAVGQQRYFFGEDSMDAAQLGVVCEGISTYPTCPGQAVFAMPGVAGGNRLPCTQSDQLCGVGYNKSSLVLGEALTQTGALLGTMLLRQNRSAPMRTTPSESYASSALCYLSDMGLIRDNPGYLQNPGDAPSLWYFLGPNILWGNLADYSYGQDPEDDALRAPRHVEQRMSEAIVKSADWWLKIVQSFNDNFNHTGYNISNFVPTDIEVHNTHGDGYHTWRELDSAAGFAYLLVVSATAKHGSVEAARQNQPKLVDAIMLCLQWLDDLGNQLINPLYEMLLPYGALAAARVNAELGTRYNVTRMIAQSLGDGVNFESYSPWRRGWGMIADRWGGQDVSGIIGSTLGGRPGPGLDPRAGNWDDPGCPTCGYAFFGNTAWFMQAIAPIPLYSPQHTKVIAKWLLHALSSSRFFLSEHVPHQLSNVTTGLKYDPHKVLAYESCRKCDFDIATSTCLHGKAYGPFAQTDANGGPQGLGAYCSQALYGGTYMSVLGALVWRTNVSTILQLDIGALDYHRANFSTDRAVSAEFLLFNPNDQPAVVAFNRSSLGPAFSKPSAARFRLSVRGQNDQSMLCYIASGQCVVTLAADEATIFVATPEEG